MSDGVLETRLWLQGACRPNFYGLGLGFESCNDIFAIALRLNARQLLLKES